MITRKTAKIALTVGAGIFAATGFLSVPRALAQGAAVRNLPCGPQALAVTRVVEIDASGGPLFGQQQYKDHDFLAPGEVVLTFDDGPLRAYTLPVLNALEAHCAKATFFMVGKMAVADPEMVKEVARRGHTIGTHTWSHNYHLGRTNPVKAREEIELGLSAVQRALGLPVAPFFRFPFLSDSPAAIAHLGQRGTAVFSIDVDSLDYRSKGLGGANEVVRRVMRDLGSRGKGILLFHDIQASTARGLPEVLVELKAKGYRLVHVVPKLKATTLAEFDALVDRVAGKKQLAAAQNPLAQRTITWPMSVDGKPQAGVGGASIQGSAVSVYPGPAGQPWQKQPGGAMILPPGAPAGVPPVVAAEPLPRPALRGPIEEDWRRRIFENR